MSTKQKVEHVVFRGSADSGDGWPPEDPAGFMAWFQDKINDIPEEHRADTKIELGILSGYYGEATPEIEITYLADETDDQLGSRLKREAAQREQAKLQFLTFKERAEKAHRLFLAGKPP